MQLEIPQYPLPQLAVFIDFENLAIWADDESVTFYMNDLLRYLSRRGQIAIKQAYANWKNFDEYRYDMTLNAIDLIQIYSVGQGKNRADIRLVLDALEAALLHPHLSTFVIVSGDSDFGPLASKLHKYGKKVIGIGPPGERSHRLFVRACDEFVFLNQVLNLRPRRAESYRSQSAGGNGLSMALRDEEEDEDMPASSTAIVLEPDALESLPLDDPQSLRPIWEDILTQELPLGQPVTPAGAQKLASEAMEARKNQRFGRSVRKFLQANRLLWEALREERTEAELTELRWMMASYASVKAGQMLNRKDFNGARAYYLAFFALLTVDDGVQNRVEGLINPMLTYYWGSAFRELGLRMPTGFQGRMLMPAEIGRKALEHENEELRQKWQELADALEEINPELMEEVHSEMREMEPDLID